MNVIGKQLRLDTASNQSHRAKKPRGHDSGVSAAPQLPASRASAHAAVPRITLSVDEAAAALGVSRDHLERHILRDLRVVYSGRRRLIPLRELERWAERQAVAVPSAALKAQRA